jgi:hypothetical protein
LHLIRFQKYSRSCKENSGKLQNEIYFKIKIIHIALDIPKSLSMDSAVEVKPLEESHAAILASKWEYAEPHAIEAITHCIKNLRSMGTFVEGKLVSWAILSTMKNANVLYTEEKH